LMDLPLRSRPISDRMGGFRSYGRVCWCASGSAED
jgi:hypothetical protein